mmetsp:Transcript_19904/g.39067  ORF Transcript_19904/g.39067 Transcript_19904/m.39067 type:complete len:189 (+) Transcript_19904:126-692(+)|eukprot:CAMPEP_0171503416 /NCGR_PEP_ID=MMETSP0958-20121227/10862_1 /TAXON_ID=87120 /ORGANISM="Aurantiochytrium limacinum, Strain ATCCMYA-1381" /LENGTH=188 /DNA_ID=CAMNT_0012038861 /DNA_START=127 /DNA_END=693 /DNA_ORIENTATION=+
MASALPTPDAEAGPARLYLPDIWAVKKERDDDDTMPNQPGVALTAHVVSRVASLGAFAGMAGVIRGMFKGSLPFAVRSVAAGTTLGGIAGLGMLQFKALTKDNFDADGIRDRAYRLANNPTQSRFQDRARMVVPGLAVAAAVTPLPVSVVTRVLFGTGIGLDICFAMMAQEMREAKAKAGETTLRTMD